MLKQQIKLSVRECVYRHVPVHLYIVHHCVCIVHLGVSECVSMYIQVLFSLYIFTVTLQLRLTSLFTYIYFRVIWVCVWLFPYWRASLGVSPTNLNKGHSGRMHTRLWPLGSQEACMMEIARESQIIEIQFMCVMCPCAWPAHMHESPH